MTSAMYLRSMAYFEKFVPQKFMPLWKHPAGPQTIFFWSPLFKWGLVVAGIGDLQRPAEKISVPQSSALAATGFIWSRYSLVIIPKNWSLCSVNFFVGLTALYSVVRGIRHQMNIDAAAVPAITATATAASSKETEEQKNQHLVVALNK